MSINSGLLLSAAERLYSAVVSDTLDQRGLVRQAMHPRIRPLDESLRFVGRARTGVYAEVYHVEPGENPYELEIELIDDLKPGDVVVLSCGGSTRIAPWGELLSTASVARKAAGCVTDGFVRDVLRIREMKFPVFHGGIAPVDSKGRGKVVDIDVPVECGGVAVRPDDIVVGDADGIVVIPGDIASEVLEAALEKVCRENSTRKALQQGMLLRAVFDKYQVL